MNSYNNTFTPLAERLRPKKLNEIIGQEDLLGQEGAIKKQVESQNLSSMILWGEAGIGKTTLALAIAKELKRTIYTLNATSDGVKSIREIVLKIEKNQNSLFQESPILFIDEIHSLNKSKQDSLLNIVEKGLITLIGATTENPSFEIISPLISRCNVYVLKKLSDENLTQILQNAIKKDVVLSKLNIELKEVDALLKISSGDARKLLNTLETTINIQNEKDTIEVTNEQVLKASQQNIAIYDKNGEYHYNLISAFIKSVRGSDPNAAVFYLARMLEGGEDIKFIARRLIILASEDIGNANPMGLIVANNCFEAINKIGMPEARIILSQCTTYLACSPKSNASYLAIEEGTKLARNNTRSLPPLHLRNAPTKLMKNLGYGKNYAYAHSYEDNFINQEYMPDELTGTVLYNPQNNKTENAFREFLKNKWKEKYNY